MSIRYIRLCRIIAITNALGPCLFVFREVIVVNCWRDVLQRYCFNGREYPQSLREILLFDQTLDYLHHLVLHQGVWSRLDFYGRATGVFHIGRNCHWQFTLLASRFGGLVKLDGSS